MIEGLTIAMALVLAGLTQQPEAAERPAAPGTGSRASEGWTDLFNGKDLSGWYTFLQKHGKNHDPDGVITIDDGVIHLYKQAAEGSTVVMGYIATEQEYGDYHLRFQYRWGQKKFQPRYALKRDAGLYYHITGPDAVWPRALQFQIEQTNVGDLIALHGMELDTWIDPATRAAEMATYQDPGHGGQPRVLGGKGIAYQKRLPGNIEVEGWNTVEVIARGETTVHRLNGQVVNQGKNIRFLPPEPGARPGHWLAAGSRWRSRPRRSNSAGSSSASWTPNRSRDQPRQDCGQCSRGLLDRRGGVLEINQFPGQVLLVRPKVEQSVAAEVEDDALLAVLGAAQVGHGRNRMRSLGRGDDPFGPREQDCGVEDRLCGSARG